MSEVLQVLPGRYAGHSPLCALVRDGGSCNCHQNCLSDDVAGTLRRIADEIDAGKHGQVTTAVLCLGDTSPDEQDGDKIISGYTCGVFGFGPRSDIFTVRGLLATASKDA